MKTYRLTLRHMYDEDYRETVIIQNVYDQYAALHFYANLGGYDEVYPIRIEELQDETPR